MRRERRRRRKKEEKKILRGVPLSFINHSIVNVTPSLRVAVPGRTQRHGNAFSSYAIPLANSVSQWHASEREKKTSCVCVCALRKVQRNANVAMQLAENCTVSRAEGLSAVQPATSLPSVRKFSVTRTDCQMDSFREVLEGSECSCATLHRRTWRKVTHIVR